MFEVSPLEAKARECMEIARETTNLGLAMGAQDCALTIRKLPGWSVYGPETPDAATIERIELCITRLKQALWLTLSGSPKPVANARLTQAKEALARRFW